MSNKSICFSFEIASNITQNSYGLVFGFNTFLALSFQTILTSIVADSVGLALPPRDQVQDNTILGINNLLPKQSTRLWESLASSKQGCLI